MIFCIKLIARVKTKWIRHREDNLHEISNLITRCEKIEVIVHDLFDQTDYKGEMKWLMPREAILHWMSNLITQCEKIEVLVHDLFDQTDW